MKLFCTESLDKVQAYLLILKKFQRIHFLNIFKIVLNLYMTTLNKNII